MDFEHPFVQEVRANPHDDAPRLIFADYLEEAGDLRGELIRVQVALSHLPPGDPARRELELRESELLENADEWLAPLKELGAEGMSARCFQRGLIERVRISADAFLKHGVELCRQAPALYWLELRTGGDLSALSRVCAKPIPAQVTALDLSANKLAAADLSLMAASGWPHHIESLSLAFNQLEDAAMAALGQWPVLTELNLSVNRIGPAGIDTLVVRRPAVPRLTSLALSLNPIGDTGLTQLAQSILAGQIKHLDLGKTDISAAGIVRTASSPLWQGIERLILRGNKLGEGFNRAMEVLASAPRLSHLDLRGTHASTGRYGYGAAAPPGPPSELAQRLGEGLLW